MRVKDRCDLAAELGPRSWKGGRRERGAILIARCLATGYHRKYAMAVLRGRRRVGVRRRGARARRYGLAFQQALLVAWAASGSVCSVRLQPFLPERVPLLEQHPQLPVDAATRERLLTASVSTVERALAPKRTSLVGRRMAQTKPGTRLRRQIPALVGAWKAADVPGYLEIDLVSPSGEDAAGIFLYTLSTVDLATGWTERVALLGKGQIGVVAGLDRIREPLPFPLRSLHPDTGSDFINMNLFDDCAERGIIFTRSRPSHSNDNCHVGRKNWTVVRRLIGYDRLDTPAQQAWLDAFSTDDLRPFANGFRPVMKLVGKRRPLASAPGGSTTPPSPPSGGSSTTIPAISTCTASAPSPTSTPRSARWPSSGASIVASPASRSTSGSAPMPDPASPRPPHPPEPVPLPPHLRSDCLLTERWPQGQVPC